ncbi:MAG: cytochrome D1 domain-containing protein, partial [Aquificaceae bacterium]
LVVLLLLPIFAFCEKLYVVERERGALAVVEGDGRLKGEIEDLGNLNHATVKFHKGFAYVISRDGFLSKIDPKEDKLVKKVKVGNSGIGFDFFKEYVVVANYDPDTVVLLDKDLNIVKVIKTGSRNVGIKAYPSGFVFALMDKDEVWVVEGGGIKSYRDVGRMPFDALLYEDRYLVGFFGEPSLGILDLRKGEYSKVALKTEGEAVFKIPHFGTWGVVDGVAYVPAVGARRLYILNLKELKLEGSISLSGLPVFVVASPDKRFLAVNFSGDREDYIALVDVSERRVIKEVQVGKRIMHMRFSKDGKRLYASSYFDSKLKVLDLPDLKLVQELEIPNPSGVFVLP